MGITYEAAVKKYIELREECERIEAEAKKKVADIRQKMHDIELWLTAKAKEDGLETIKTPDGTGYWSTHYSATVADADTFKRYVIDTQSFDLLETRPSRSAVKAFVEAYHEPPPGINFSAVRVFNVRVNRKEV